jgi:selenium metabolism protein YedF
MKVDARGKPCPTPVIMTKKALESADSGAITVIVDSEISKENVLKFLKSQGLEAEVTLENGEFTIEFEKGNVGNIPKEETVPKKENNSSKIVLYVGSEGIGNGDCDLGKKLMDSFIGNIKNMDEYPASIIFVNTGVFLTTTNENTVKFLKELKEGEILSCGTCLEHFNLTDSLQVGEITNAYTIMQKLFSADKVIRL